MSTETRQIDITNEPALRRLVNEVRKDKQPRRLLVDGEHVAELRPVGAIAKLPRKLVKPRSAPTQEDREAFLASFGAWKGLVDVPRLKRNLKASRALRAPGRRAIAGPPQSRRAKSISEGGSQ
jgi:hypothetical protein